MKTSQKREKAFDTVAFMRRRRNEIAKEIKLMTPKQEIEYYKSRAIKVSKKNAK